MTRSARVRTAAALLAACAVFQARDAAAQGARQGMLSLETARLYYEVIGEGEPIIVVHGGPGLDHEYLQPGLDVLASRYVLVYYDQRGTGRSTAELSETTINLDAFVGDIDALRQALELEQVTLLAHSWGAIPALEYAATYPGSLRALILMNPVEPGSRFAAEQEARRRAATTPEDSTQLAELTSGEAFAAHDPATVSQAYRLMFRPALRDPERVAELDLDLAGPTARNGPRVAELLGASTGRIDWWSRLGTLDVPVLVLHGRHDVVPLEMSQALAAAMPRARLVVLNSGHFPYLEDRDGLMSAISSFFVDLSR